MKFKHVVLREVLHRSCIEVWLGIKVKIGALRNLLVSVRSHKFQSLNKFINIYDRSIKKKKKNKKIIYGKLDTDIREKLRNPKENRLEIRKLIIFGN